MTRNTVYKALSSAQSEWVLIAMLWKVSSSYAHYSCLQPLCLSLLFNTWHPVSSAFKLAQDGDNIILFTPFSTVFGTAPVNSRALFAVFCMCKKKFTMWVHQVNSLLQKKKPLSQYLFKHLEKLTIYVCWYFTKLNHYPGSASFKLPCFYVPFEISLDLSVF